MSTIYDKTDNYGLNLYGDNDPADLRDGYNGSMRTIDTTLEQHLNRIESMESHETHDEEVAKALLGDNTVDAATAAKTKWDKAGTDAIKAIADAAAATGKADNNMAILAALGAGTVSDATIVRDSNAMDISKLGCKKDDPNFDNATIINNYVNTAHKSIYIPDGDWYIKTTLLTQDVNVYSDGWVKASNVNNFTDGVMVLAQGSTELENSANMPKGKKICININGSGESVSGLAVQGFFGAEIKANVIACMDTAVETRGRNIECKFFLALYGGLTSDAVYGECGLRVAKNDNDNYAYVVGRNFKIGVDLNASIWTFQYLHIWGCNNVLKLYPNTTNYAYMLYADYSHNGSVVCDSQENSAQLICCAIFAILESGQYFVGTPDGKMNYVKVVANSYKSDTPHNVENRSQGASFMKVRPSQSVLLTQSRIEDFGNGANLVVSEEDLNTKSLTELLDKYGPICFHCNLQDVTFERYKEFSTWEEFRKTQYYRNMVALGYPLPSALTGSEEYHYGRVSLTVERSHYTRVVTGAPLATYNVNVLLGTNIRGFYDAEKRFYQYNIKELSSTSA
jgi:hypothetical protein